jgi:hypothetical protein
VPLVISHPLRGSVAGRRELRNADLHDLLLNPEVRHAGLAATAGQLVDA